METNNDYELELYAIQRKDGKWFSKYEWVSALKDAKVYAHIGSARGKITRIAIRSAVRNEDARRAARNDDV